MPKKLDYASLYTLRSDGRYQGYWRDEAGKRHALCDRDPARLHERLAEKEAPKTLTFRDIAEAWHDSTWERVKRGTIACYTAAYNRALDRFGDRPATELLPKDISAHLEQMKRRGYGLKSVQTQRTVYRQIYEYAMTDEKLGTRVQVNPVLGVPLPRDLPHTTREAPEDEAVEIIRRSVTTARFGLFPFFLMATGLRRGEALGVKWSDVDYARKLIHVRDAVKYHGNPVVDGPKTEAGVRTVPLLPDLERVLIMPEGAKPEDRIFHGEKAPLMPEATYRRNWLRYCIDTGLVTDDPETYKGKNGHTYTRHHYKPTLTAHVLRHGYATMLYDAGVDVYTARDLLGHKDVQVTQSIYTHISRRRKEGSLALLTEYVNNDYKPKSPETKKGQAD